MSAVHVCVCVCVCVYCSATAVHHVNSETGPFTESSAVIMVACWNLSTVDFQSHLC